VRQLFEEAVVEAGPARSELFDGPAALATVAVGVGPADAGVPSPDSPFPVVHALFWLTANLAARDPLLLVIDDAHWADPPSLRYLGYLAARLEGVPASVLVAARPAEPLGRVDLLARVRDRPGTVLVRRGPLSEAATSSAIREWLGVEPDPEFAAACHQASGGNPFLLTGLVAALAVDGIEPRADAAAKVGDLGPDTVARALMLRLSRLPPEAAAVADAVAVLGVAGEIRHVAPMTELAPEVVGEAADLLSDAYIFSRSRPLTFIHPVVRQAIYRELRPSARAQLHARAAKAMLAERQQPAAVGPHLLATEPANDEMVVEVLRAAAATAFEQGAADLAHTYPSRALAEPPPRNRSPTCSPGWVWPRRSGAGSWRRRAGIWRRRRTTPRNRHSGSVASRSRRRPVSTGATCRGPWSCSIASCTRGPSMPTRRFGSSRTKRRSASCNHRWPRTRSAGSTS
jgi:hypothetical protein